ncbi:lytic transglycosylase domain-containing protein [Hansschlegelia sp.]|uniref:lytic transglycosylase domain-containing protein n=1 Tax=Hansschlegelia sp. TaxID=2041892 RepID=UPI002C816A3C|nr:lytic transglycosylase domain-containing protein [Hansschlegelia sp.]HVI28218.1 lytic transglycosylase domain-containing protein [Hansschlegelia sp.]
MQLITPADAAGGVAAALRKAAQATGASFDYLLQTAKRESSLDPAAKAPTSSARGLFQFIDQTWLQVLKEDGPSLGLSDEAADVSRTASGRYVVSDPARRAELLALRDDPTASALLAGAFTRRNADTLSSALGRPATGGELYAAHFLGAQGAIQLVNLATNVPTASAADAFPTQASANRAIFFDKGRPRTVSEVYARITAAHGEVPSATPAAPAALALQEASQDDRYGPFNGGVEDDAAPFHSLFKTGRRSPVSAYVAQAWSSFGAAGLVSDAAPVAQAGAGSAGTASASRRRASASEEAQQTSVAQAAVLPAAAAQAEPSSRSAASPADAPSFLKIHLAAPSASSPAPQRIARR